MKKSPDAASAPDAETTVTVGFCTLDEKGRSAMPKAVRTALGVHSGSSLVYIVLDDAVLFIPQDAHLAQLQEAAIQSLTEADLTVEDLLAQLPQARDAVMREAYRPDFLAKLRQMRVEHAASEEKTIEDASHAQRAE